MNIQCIYTLYTGNIQMYVLYVQSLVTVYVFCKKNLVKLEFNTQRKRIYIYWKLPKVFVTWMCMECIEIKKITKYTYTRITINGSNSLGYLLFSGLFDSTVMLSLFLSLNLSFSTSFSTNLTTTSLQHRLGVRMGCQLTWWLSVSPSSLNLSNKTSSSSSYHDSQPDFSTRYLNLITHLFISWVKMVSLTYVQPASQPDALNLIFKTWFQDILVVVFFIECSFPILINQE